MNLRRTRLTGALLAVLGVLGMAGAWPGLVVFNTSAVVCIQVNPAQSWLASNLHLLVHSSACPDGSLAPTPAMTAAVGFSVMISVSALLAGLTLGLLGLGLSIGARRFLRSARGWLRRRFLPVLLGGLMAPAAVPVPVRVPGRRAQRAHLPQTRRGPPSHC